MAADASADRHRFVEDATWSAVGRRVHFDCKLVDKWIERYHLARGEISLEQVA